jgi:hypothetical protein
MVKYVVRLHPEAHAQLLALGHTERAAAVQRLPARSVLKADVGAGGQAVATGLLRRLLTPWTRALPLSSGCARPWSNRAWTRRDRASVPQGGRIAHSPAPKRPNYSPWPVVPLRKAEDWGRANFWLTSWSHGTSAHPPDGEWPPDAQKMRFSHDSSSTGGFPRRPPPSLSVPWRTGWQSTPAPPIPSARRGAWTRPANHWLAEPWQPLLAAPRQPECIDYEYERPGTANLLMGCEPLVAHRRGKVTERRTAVDFAHLIHAWVEVPPGREDGAGDGYPQHS